MLFSQVYINLKYLLKSNPRASGWARFAWGFASLRRERSARPSPRPRYGFYLLGHPSPPKGKNNERQAFKGNKRDFFFWYPPHRQGKNKGNMKDFQERLS